MDDASGRDKSRDKFVDFLRGIAIIQMMMAHYAYAFPKSIAKIISYHDVAMEGFILLSGFVIGWHYLPEFKINRWNISYKIAVRIVKIVNIQYILIVLTSIPSMILIYGSVTIERSLVYYSKSFLFLNQIGIIHILPTFIPLLLFSVIILVLLEKSYDGLAFAVSVVMFIIGQNHPYIISPGEKTIFPFILWQIYFVIGCIAGKYSKLNNAIIQGAIGKITICACVILSVVLLFRHSNTFSKELSLFMMEQNISINRFPLNVYGLIYGMTIWLFIYAIFSRVWNTIKDCILTLRVSEFGKYSLMIFFLHVLFAKYAELYFKRFNADVMIVHGIIIMNIIACVFAVKKYESANVSNNYMLGRYIQWLFK